MYTKGEWHCGVNVDGNKYAPDYSCIVGGWCDLVMNWGHITRGHMMEGCSSDRGCGTHGDVTHVLFLRVLGGGCVCVFWVVGEEHWKSCFVC